MAALPQLPPPAAATLRGLWRRRWPAVWAAWAVAWAGWLGVAAMPDRYQSKARVYIETETMLRPLLKNIAVENDVQRELEMMQRTLVNRDNLAELAASAGLAGEGADRRALDALYRRLEKRIEVKAEGRNLFSVAYVDGDPRRAQTVVATLLTLFVDANTGRNRADMESARAFIESQIAEYEDKLKRTDEKLARYKAEHYDVLSATGANFAGRIENARQAVAAARIRHQDAVIARDQLRAHLAATPHFLDFAPMQGANAQPLTAAGRLSQAQAALAQLRLRYTDRHPDVQAALRTVEMLRAAGEGSDGGAVAGRMPNALYEQIKLRLVQAEAAEATAQSQLALAEDNLKRLSALGETAPGVEAGLADLDREYGVLKAKYEDLLSRRESVRIGAAAESSGDKVRFRIVEQPQVPVTPSSPNRPLLVTLVLAAALAAGGGLALLLHRLDDAVDGPESVAAAFGLKVLASVPRVERGRDVADRRRGARRFGTAMAGLLACYVVVAALSFHQAGAVQSALPATEEGEADAG